MSGGVLDVAKAAEVRGRLVADGRRPIASKSPFAPPLAPAFVSARFGQPLQEIGVAPPFDGFGVEPHLRPSPRDHPFDLDHTLSAVVALEAQVPDDAFTAAALGTDRSGHAIP